MSASNTPRLDAARVCLAAQLRMLESRLSAATKAGADDTSLESKMRATIFRVRIRNTIRELETSSCK